MPTRLRLSCRALLINVLARPNFYSAGPQAPHQLNPALSLYSSPIILVFPIVLQISWRNFDGIVVKFNASVWGMEQSYSAGCYLFDRSSFCTVVFTRRILRPLYGEQSSVMTLSVCLSVCLSVLDSGNICSIFAQFLGTLLNSLANTATQIQYKIQRSSLFMVGARFSPLAALL